MKPEQLGQSKRISVPSCSRESRSERLEKGPTVKPSDIAAWKHMS